MLFRSTEASDKVKTELATALEDLSAEPTTEEIDNIYSILAGDVPADKWDGKVLTFTNVQQSGAERVLYINGSNVLDLSTSSAEEVGDAAKFICKKEASGKYSFFNEKAQLYMIWRAGGNYGHNNNSGTLAVYNATYCDWSINPGSVADRYYLVSKRASGSDGSLIVMTSGAFDAYSAAEGYTANYSNLFRIDAADVETGIGEMKEQGAKSKDVYDLQGRKVENPAKGMYIINGKKVFVK